MGGHQEKASKHSNQSFSASGLDPVTITTPWHAGPHQNTSWGWYIFPTTALNLRIQGSLKCEQWFLPAQVKDPRIIKLPPALLQSMLFLRRDCQKKATYTGLSLSRMPTRLWRPDFQAVNAKESTLGQKGCERSHTVKPTRGAVRLPGSTEDLAHWQFVSASSSLFHIALLFLRFPFGQRWSGFRHFAWKKGGPLLVQAQVG